MITAKIDGQEVTLAKNTLNISGKIEQRETCSFRVVDTTGMRFYKGQPVSVFIDDKPEFLGTLLSSNIVETTQAGDRWHQIRATGHHYSADKRLAVKAYEEETAGAIVKDLLSSYLVEEGILGTDIEEEYNTTEQWQEGTLHQTIAENDKLMLDGTETEETSLPLTKSFKVLPS